MCRCLEAPCNVTTLRAPPTQSLSLQVGVRGIRGSHGTAQSHGSCETPVSLSYRQKLFAARDVRLIKLEILQRWCCDLKLAEQGTRTPANTAITAIHQHLSNRLTARLQAFRCCTSCHDTTGTSAHIAATAKPCTSLVRLFNHPCQNYRADSLSLRKSPSPSQPTFFKLPNSDPQRICSPTMSEPIRNKKLESMTAP